MKVTEPFTQREIKQLHALLAKFYRSCKGNKTEIPNEPDPADFLSVGEKSIVSTVQQWVKWFMHDEMEMDLSDLKK